MHRGKEIIESQDDDICPFCQQRTITESFRQQIAAYFDQNFTSRIAMIEELKEQYSNSSTILISALNLLLSRIEEINDTDISLLKPTISEIRRIISSNESLLDAKYKEPSGAITLVNTSELLRSLCDNVIEINTRIASHNNMVANIDTEKKSLKKDVWNTLASQVKDKVERANREKHNLRLAIRGLTASINDKAIKHTELKQKLQEKELQIKSVMPTVTSINEMLLRFGFTSFKLVQGETNGYMIKRENGSVATETLSEGELTFISFLYFMHLIKGSVDGSSISGDRIVVIDDPVSSLDSDVLFVVSSLIKELLKDVAKKDSHTDVKQVILLTHNIYFHKEVSFIDKGKIDSRKYWILRKDGNNTNIKAYGTSNPIKSSYELLWSDLQLNKDSDNFITVQNIMRRILETYFTVFGGYFYCDRILDKIQNRDDKEIARSLLCWANEGSHIIPDDLYAPPANAQVSRYMEVFKMIFEQLGQNGHYNMMMHIKDDATA